MGLKPNHYMRYMVPRVLVKTQLSFSLTSTVMAKKESVWFIDCEGTFDEERLEEICLNRDVKYDTNLVKYNLVTDSEDMLEIINTKGLEHVINGSVRVIIIDGLVGLFRMLIPWSWESWLNVRIN